MHPSIGTPFSLGDRVVGYVSYVKIQDEKILVEVALLTQLMTESNSKGNKTNLSRPNNFVYYWVEEEDG